MVTKENKKYIEKIYSTVRQLQGIVEEEESTIAHVAQIAQNYLGISKIWGGLNINSNIYLMQVDIGNELYVLVRRPNVFAPFGMLFQREPVGDVELWERSVNGDQINANMIAAGWINVRRVVCFDRFIHAVADQLDSILIWETEFTPF